MAEKQEPERRSTLFLRGEAAVTLSEMQAFVRDVQERPRVRLLADIPQLLGLTESKFHLVKRVLTNRMKAFDPKDRAAVLAVLMQQSQSGRQDFIRERAATLTKELGQIS